jgi:hypothetical protein
MRKEFEVWFGGEKSILVGEHAELFEGILWHVWQASRQSQVVKLPTSLELYNSTANEVLEAVQDALDAAGVRYE